MCSNEVEKMIQQYGEAARKYKDKAIKIGNTYIIPNFGFDPRMEIYLDILLAPRKEWNHGLVDIRVFATPEDFVLFDFDEEVTEAQIDDLLSLLRELYPKDYTYAGLPEYWN